MDAITLLKEDHKLVKKLFHDFEKAAKDGSSKRKRELVDEICKELVTHSYIEETIFYPAARQHVSGVDDEVLESVEEHHVVAWLLSELQDLDPDDETFDAKVTVLIENTRHHMDEEESDLFPAVRDAMGRNDLAEIGQEMQDAKAKAPADPLALSSAKS